jgi:hypothetical protein
VDIPQTRQVLGLIQREEDEVSLPHLTHRRVPRQSDEPHEEWT